MKKTEVLPCWECGELPLVDKNTVFCANTNCTAHLPIVGRERWNELTKLFSSEEFKRDKC